VRPHLDRYRLQVLHPQLKLSETVNITNYCSGEGPDRNQEQWLLMDKLRQIVDSMFEGIAAHVQISRQRPKQEPDGAVFFLESEAGIPGQGFA
jgi:hypothetical protein